VILRRKNVISDTWGASHALARFSADDTTIAPVGAAATCIAGLPVAALRLATAFQGDEFARSPEREGRS
jgi:protein ImuB